MYQNTRSTIIAVWFVDWIQPTSNYNGIKSNQTNKNSKRWYFFVRKDNLFEISKWCVALDIKRFLWRRDDEAIRETTGETLGTWVWVPTRCNQCDDRVCASVFFRTISWRKVFDRWSTPWATCNEGVIVWLHQAELQQVCCPLPSPLTAEYLVLRSVRITKGHLALEYAGVGADIFKLNVRLWEDIDLVNRRLHPVLHLPVRNGIDRCNWFEVLEVLFLGVISRGFPSTRMIGDTCRCEHVCRVGLRGVMGEGGGGRRVWMARRGSRRA